MNKQHALSLVVLAVSAAFTVVACGGDDPPPQDPSMQPGYGTPPQGYGTPQPAYTAPAPAPTQPAPAAANPLALPCQADGGLCGTHKCNLTTQRCAFPCTGAQDCMAGTNCMAGICLPGGTP